MLRLRTCSNYRQRRSSAKWQQRRVRRDSSNTSGLPNRLGGMHTLVSRNREVLGNEETALRTVEQRRLLVSHFLELCLADTRQHCASPAALSLSRACPAARDPETCHHIPNEILGSTLSSVFVSTRSIDHPKTSIELGSVREEGHLLLSFPSTSTRRLYSSCRACAPLDAWTPIRQRVHTCPEQDVKLLSWPSR